MKNIHNINDFDLKSQSFKIPEKSDKFYSHKTRKRQELIRSEESKASCEICGAVFKWKNRHNFRRHMKNIHNINDFDLKSQSFKIPEKSDTVSKTKMRQEKRQESIRNE